MLIAQLSDPHIKAFGHLAYRRVDTAKGLAECIAHVRQRRPRPDLVLFTGDLTDFGRPEEYAHLKALLALLDLPVFLMPGNHDDRAAMRAAWPDAPWPGGDGPLHYVIDRGPVKIVCLDSVVPGRPGGELGPDALAWLDGRLAAEPARPTLVALHHPPFLSGIAGMDGACLADREGLGAVLARHPQVERVICGHLHRVVQAMIGGRPAVSGPGTSHQVALDLAPGVPESLVLEPTGYLLHLWLPGQGLITHAAVAGAFAGPYPFVEDGHLIDE
jgi:3',5'-cyclic AMP phosphodiesterase CpdA